MLRSFWKKLVYIVMLISMCQIVTACGSGSSSSTPTTVPNSATIFYAHNLVFKNSTTLLSTGYNGFGQLGTGNLGSRTTPGGLNQYYPFRGYAVGGNHSVAFTNNSSAVYSWGYNGFGQLGNNSTTYSSTPVRTGTITGVISLAAGAYHTLAVKSDGTVWAWGSNDAGQLGVPWGQLVNWTALVPVQVTGSQGSNPFANVSSVAANGKHSLARANGRVWAWGLNSNGQIGIQTTTGAIADPTVVPVPVPSVAGIAAGSAFSLAVGSDGTLWAWGANDNGQLGNGTTLSSHQPVQVMKNASTPLTGVVQAAGGIQHGLARLSDGTVWAWGYNHFGQLGNGQAFDQLFAVPATSLPPGIVSDIRAFGSSSMAKVDGVWYVWGDNTYGQLGTGSSGTVLTPVKMSGF